MANKFFENSLNRISQPTPPIWFMRQAGRYHSHYNKLKEKYTFEQLCKNPELASEVACGPIQEFDFDVAILFSDILFPLEGLGLPLKFNPGPIFGEFIRQDNYQQYANIDKAIEHMEFQRNAITSTREKLPKNKSLIGFVGGLWTLLCFALNKKNQSFHIEDFHFVFMKETLLPLIKRNIQLQLDAGAEIIMIFDSSLGQLSFQLHKSQYISFIKDLAETFPNQLGYYCRGKSKIEIELLFPFSFAGLGIDHQIDIANFLSNYDNGFIQGNFDETKMLMDKESLSKEIHAYCDHIESSNTTKGWICGLGHGINKKTPEENVHLFIDIIRKRFQ